MSDHTLQKTSILILGACFLLTILMILFSSDLGTTGKETMATTVFILNSSPINCNFDVAAGYNIISMPCLSTAVPITDITNSTQLWSMYQYIPGQTDLWAVYNPNLPAYVVSDLQFMTRRSGYVVIMNSSANITYNGLNVSQTGIPLVAGWNLVGYPAFIRKNATLVFGGLPLTLAVTYDRASASFISYPSGGLVYTVPGNGYWINVTSAQTWTVTSS